MIPLQVPPLRHRLSDLPLLTEVFCRRHGESLRRDIRLGAGVLDALGRYAWPGNVRELQNALECAATLCDAGTIEVKDLPPHVIGAASAGSRGLSVENWVEAGRPLREYLQEKEHEYMDLVLEKTGGNRARAADLLGISRATFYRRYPDLPG